MIDIVKCEEGYEVFFSSNDVHLGMFAPVDDGYYAFFPMAGLGKCWSQELLGDLAEELENLNGKWNAQVQKDIGGES